jgi:2-polyprenyl-3-methyl-5-hydroxy-6-metoxy-1,4-benzoquinol methylase
VKPFAPLGGRLMDFGCGPGPVLAGLLRKHGYTVDTHDKFFDHNLDWENRTYDLITLTEVLEHLVDPLETLSNLARHLTTGGVISIMTLFHPNDLESFSQWWYRKDPTHISFYTPQTIGEMGRLLGMKTVFNDSRRVIVLGK